jgi:hypothetical protein
VYNTDVVRLLLLNAYDPNQFDIFCYDYYKPVWLQFGSEDNREDRVQKLIVFAERYGILYDVIERTRKYNDYQYQRFEKDLHTSPISPASPVTTTEDETEITHALGLARHVVHILENQKKRYGTQPIPARFAIMLDQRRKDVKVIEQQLEDVIRKKRGSKKGSITWDLWKKIEGTGDDHP